MIPLLILAALSLACYLGLLKWAADRDRESRERADELGRWLR